MGRDGAAPRPGDLAPPLRNVGDLDPLLDRIGSARYVLLGEASHGTHEYYGWRTEITRRLVVAVLHREVGDDALFSFPQLDAPQWLTRAHTHRAIGVVDHPDRDRWGNYVPTVVGQRYDALLNFERTEALRPMRPQLPSTEEPETVPHGV